VLVGRTRHQASVLSTGLRKLGATVLEIPFIEIRRPRSFRRLDAALRNLEGYDWLILTSVNGVEAMWERLDKLRLTKKIFKHLSVAAIGPATRKAIEQRGGFGLAQSVTNELLKHQETAPTQAVTVQ